MIRLWIVFAMAMATVVSGYTTPSDVGKFQLDCPDPFVSLGGFCYFFSERQLNWIQSLESCRRMNSSLAMILSQEEQQLVSVHAIQRGKKEYWLGGYDQGHEGYWFWELTKESIAEYWNWSEGEPDSGKGKYPENCLVLSGRYQYTWDDRPCHIRYNYLCKHFSSMVPRGCFPNCQVM